MPYCEADYGEASRRLRADVLRVSFPGPPQGYAPLQRARSMRAVLTGLLPGPRGLESVVLKWHRPRTLADRVKGWILGGKAAREGRVLREMRRAGVAAPQPLFWWSSPDLLVTRHMEGLTPLPPADRAPRHLVTAVASLVGQALAAGLRPRDLHAGNLALQNGRPLLVDLGSARVAPRSAGDPASLLGRIGAPLLAEATRSQRFRALREALAAWSPAHVGRESVRKSESILWREARRGWRHRDRRVRRGSRHYVVFPGGLRRADLQAGAVLEMAQEGLRHWPPGNPNPPSRALHAHGQVVWIEDPRLPAPVVAKRYAAAVALRPPRALAALRKAHALEVRHVPAPRALLCCAQRGRGSVLVSEAIPQDPLLPPRVMGLDSRKRRRLVTGLGRFVARLHSRGLSHRDLKGSNLLWQDDAGRDRFWIVDLEGVRRHRRLPSPRRRGKDLGRLLASLPLTRSERLRLMMAYCRGCVGERPEIERIYRFARSRLARYGIR